MSSLAAQKKSLFGIFLEILCCRFSNCYHRTISTLHLLSAKPLVQLPSHCCTEPSHGHGQKIKHLQLQLSYAQSYEGRSWLRMLEAWPY
ncbi:hypothetical protein DL95DRAFT_379070 [Leptodontidium sp. 2 PMI_412]|nr:hypothetical protein DL95DRAFT_379070 [Leptodontidium sp. 2 PMI_412]